MRLVLMLCTALLLASCAPALPPSGGTIASFERIDRTIGTGAQATPSSLVTVYSTSWLYDEKTADKH
ncbi:FKBP-type peptidyl-prolyl cis-trans isomerase, partial [Xanthomonas codiaei]